MSGVTCAQDGMGPDNPIHTLTPEECGKGFGRDVCYNPREHHSFIPNAASHPFDSDGDGTTPCKVEHCGLPLQRHESATIEWVSRQQWNGPVECGISEQFINGEKGQR